MSTLAFRRLAWNAVECAFVASFLILGTPIHAASSPASEAVCDVSADYALGVEDYTEAIRLYEKVLRQNSNDALAHYHLGYAYGMNHDAAGELREYRRAEQLGPLQRDLFLNLGILYHENHNTNAAIDALRTAAKVGPRHPEAVEAWPKRLARLNAFFETYRSGDEYDTDAITHVMGCVSLFPGEFIAQRIGT